MAATPNYGALLGVIWGNYYDGIASSVVASASGIIVGNNPPYSATDLFAVYPNFGGKAVVTSGTLDGATNQITNVNVAGLVIGCLIAGVGIPSGTTITSINGTTITLSANTTQAGSNVALTAYPAPIVPLPIIAAYIFLATSSIVQQRYQEMWLMAMALFIAHYLTLWLQTQSSTPNANALQIASSGLAMGIKVAKSAGDVSTGQQVLAGLEDWGAFQLTAYGQQFITIAKVIGSMPMFLL